MRGPKNSNEILRKNKTLRRKNSKKKTLRKNSKNNSKNTNKNKNSK